MTTKPEITLRALEPEDLDLVHGIENDAALWQWGSTSQPLSRYTVHQYLANQHADIYLDGQLRLVIEAEGKSVGIVVLSECQRRGLATQALRQLAEYASQHLHLRSIYAYVADENAAGQALFRASGYTPLAQLPRWIEGRHTATLFQLLLT